jgi:hypothetical protein
MRYLALGLALALGAACGAPQLAACRLDVVRVLPTNLDELTLGDLRDVRARLRACEAPAAPDGGTP